jgi:hypothetical protein
MIELELIASLVGLVGLCWVARRMMERSHADAYESCWCSDD